MNYPNIVKLYGFFREGNDLCLILEYAEGKCLFSKLNQKVNINLLRYKSDRSVTIHSKWLKPSDTATLNQSFTAISNQKTSYYVSGLQSWQILAGQHTLRNSNNFVM